MNMSRFIRRPSLWLPGVTIAFSVYASLDAMRYPHQWGRLS